MKILLVSATKFEISPLMKGLRKVRGKQNLWTGRFDKHSVDVLVTGVGMTATAFHLGGALNKKYDLAINAGIAGSFKKELGLGSVVNVVSDCFADLGAEDGDRFLTLKEMGLSKGRRKMPARMTGSDGENGRWKGKRAVMSFPQVQGITVNTVHGNAASIRKVVKKFRPDIESMEGAAFFFACTERKTPGLQIRAISNYVERRNKKYWLVNLAVRNLNVRLAGLLIKI